MLRNVRVIVLGMWFGGVSLFAQNPAPFEQDSLTDGVVTFEAEHFHTSTVVKGKAWVMVTNGTYSGSLALQALPNTGTNINTGYITNSPRLDFKVNFNRTGLHAIAIRGVGPTGNDDSLHAGIDGTGPNTCDRIFGFFGSPGWSFSTLDGGQPVALFNVPSVGLHTVNLWMKEDGFIIDKVVISSNTNFLPGGLGPPESRQGAAATADDPRATEITALHISNGVIVAEFTPAEGVESYEASGNTNIMSGLTDDPSALVQGFQLLIAPGSEPKFFGVDAVPMSTNKELTSLVLNRLAYGPTPDEIDRVLAGPTAIGPEAYIAEQLAPELILENVDADPGVALLNAKLQSNRAYSEDLQAWHILRATLAKRQLLETLMQFWDNHFNTYYWKTYGYFNYSAYFFSSDDSTWLASQFEYKELEKWRQVLLNPNGTFYDLLKISAESPAMLIYLDTVDNIAAAPNENYAREIQELFCMGVNNGYDQSDIEAMAPAWTGWKVNRVAPADVGNPHAVINTNNIIILPPRTSGWLYRKGTNQPSASWNTPAFEPAGDWFSATTSIGYGNTNTTVLTDMSNGYNTIYLRKTFVVSNLSDMATARVRVFVDDGCILYLNGQEAYRFNCPTIPNIYSNRATASVGKATWRDVTLTNAVNYFVTGTNLLAMHVLNTTIRNSDFDSDAQVYIPAAWSFLFNPADHQSTNKVIFAGKKVDYRFGAPWAGQSYQLTLPLRTGTNGIQDGYDIVAHMANLPYTEEFISVKLCQLFVHEDFHIGGYYNVSQLTPEQQLIKACMTAWETPGPDGRKGNLRAILSTIFSSPLFHGQDAAQQKIKTPFEFMVSSIRALRADLGGGVMSARTDGYDLETPMYLSGMELFGHVFPDGWPETGDKWIDTGTLNERLRFVENFLMISNDALKQVDYGSSGDDNTCDPMALVMAKLPAAQWTNDVAVVNYFLGILFPGEGSGNLDLERTEALNVLNSDDTGVPGTSFFNSLGPGTLAYNNRLRSMVALLMSGPKFHEQ